MNGIYVDAPRFLTPDTLKAMNSFLVANEVAKSLSVTDVIVAEGAVKTEEAKEQIDTSNAELLSADPNAATKRAVIIDGSQMFIYPPVPERRSDKFTDPDTPSVQVLSGLFTIASSRSRKNPSK